jgi:hypothetical protein
MEMEATVLGARFQHCYHATILRQAFSTTTAAAERRGHTVGGAKKDDLVYDYARGLLLTGANPGEVVASAAGINGS